MEVLYLIVRLRWHILLFSFNCVDTCTPISHPRSVLQTRCWWYQNASEDSMVCKIVVLIPESFVEFRPQCNHRLSCIRCWPRQNQSSFGFSLWWLAKHASNCFLGAHTCRWQSQNFCCTKAWNHSLFTPQLCLRRACRHQGSSLPFAQKKQPETLTPRYDKRYHFEVNQKSAILTHKERTDFVYQSGKLTDRVTKILRARGNPLAWNVTVPDTYAESRIISTTAEAGATAKHAVTSKATKVSDITSTHIFHSISIEAAGSWDVQAVELKEEIGKRITSARNDQKETMHLFRRISMAIKRGNAYQFFLHIQ